MRADLWSSGNLLTPAERREEIRLKEARLEALMVARGLDGILLTKARNHAWLLAGSRTWIVGAQAESPVWLLLARGSTGTVAVPSGSAQAGKRYLVASNMEGPRLMAEEGLRGLGWTERRYPWFGGAGGTQDPRRRIVDDVMPRAKLGCDGPVAGTEDIGADLSRIRFPLTATEMRRMRWLGGRSGAAVAAVCREIAPGMRETEIGNLLAAKLAREGLSPTVILVGVDGRLESFRHLVPTDEKLKRLALVNLCAEKWGLVVAVSRLVHFGPLPADLAARMQACATVDATYLRGARPGSTFGGILAEGAEAYAAMGWAEEWRNHHQGGSIGYLERESLLVPDSAETVVEGMALAFNPTLPGVKIEDTILVGPHGPEIMTRVEGWPVRRVVLDGAIWELPDILVRPAGAGSR
ncbi:MAG: M24 family metallopeptidase [Candidatus Coatesbacteria bacterium]